MHGIYLISTMITCSTILFCQITKVMKRFFIFKLFIILALLHLVFVIETFVRTCFITSGEPDSLRYLDTTTLPAAPLATDTKK